MHLEAYSSKEKESVFFRIVYEICMFKSNAPAYHIINYFFHDTTMYAVIKTHFCIPFHGLLLMLWMRFEANQLLQEV